MARNSENAPSEPSGRRRRPPEEGGSHLREHFRDSIRDALSGVDVDELQGKATLPVPTDVTLLTREVVTDLELELSKLRAERAQLEQRGVGAVEAPVEPPQRGGRWSWGRGRAAAGEVEVDAAGESSTAAWSVARAMRPVADDVREAAPGVASVPAAPVSPAPGGLGAVVPEAPVPPTAKLPLTAASPAAPDAVAHPGATPQSAPKSRTTAAPAPPKRRQPQRRTALTDGELDSVVAPLLAELATLRAEVRDLRGDPESNTPGRRPNHQMVKLVAGVLVGFALIVIALAVVLKA